MAKQLTLNQLTKVRFLVGAQQYAIGIFLCTRNRTGKGLPAGRQGRENGLTHTTIHKKIATLSRDSL